MARTNGAYSRPANSFSNPVAGTTISPTDADTTFDDFETALDTINILDTKFSLLDNGDPTKAAAFQVSSVTAGQTRTLTVPDASGTLALTSNKLSAFAATTSSELAGVISDETGSGALVFGTSPTLVTPALGTPASGVLTNCTGLPTGGLTFAATARFHGRHTASGGAGEELTGAQAMSIIGQFAGFNAPANVGITAIAAAGALTVDLVRADGSTPSATNQRVTGFQHSTVTNGYPEFVTTGGAAQLVIPSGAEFGVTSGDPVRLWITEWNNAGTSVLGAINCSTANQIYSLNEGILITTTAIGTGSDSAGVHYTSTGLTTKAFRIVGYVEWDTLTTAGTWTAPTRIRMFGPGMRKPGDEVQTIQFSTTTSTAVTSSTYTVTATTVNITPTAAQNKVRIVANGTASNGNSALTVLDAAIHRSGTALGQQLSIVGSAGAIYDAMCFSFIDTPKSASALTYAVYIKSTDNTTSCRFPTNVTGLTGYICCTEIMG